MNPIASGLVSILLTVGVSVAQVVVPAHPTRFKARPIGSSATSGVEVLPKNAGSPETVRSITYIVLSVDRIWKSTDEKLIQGKLIAFEDMVTESPKGGEPAPQPTPPETPTVVRDGKIRLLIKNKPVVVPLTRFAPVDVEFVEQVRKAYTKPVRAEP